MNFQVVTIHKEYHKVEHSINQSLLKTKKRKNFILIIIQLLRKISITLLQFLKISSIMDRFIKALDLLPRLFLKE